PQSRHLRQRRTGEHGPGAGLELRGPPPAGDSGDAGTGRGPEGEPGAGGSSGLTAWGTHLLRAVTREDRAAIEMMFRANRIFGPHEVAVALEVFDAALQPGQADYESLGAEVRGELA